MTIAIEVLGWIGAVLILLAYILLTLRRITADSYVYQGMNAVGAAGFIVNSGYNGAIPSTAVNVVWLGIAVYALWQLGGRFTRS